MMSRFTEKAQAALQRAQQIMFANQHVQLDVEHIFLALLQQRESLPAAIIARLGGDAQAMIRKLESSLSNTRGVAQGRGTATGYITLPANRVLVGSAEEADSRNDDFIGTVHLFLGVVNQQDGVTGRLLAAAGIDRDKVLAVLPDILNDPAYNEAYEQRSTAYAAQPVMKQVITPPELVKPSGYSHGILTTGGRTLYIGGQIATDGEGNLVAPGDVVEQYKQVLKNISAVVREAGGGMTDIVKLTIYVRDRADYKAHLKELGAAHREYFGNYYPATTLVEVPNFFEDGVLVEIEGVAVL
ncbi:MAG TPA: Rid family hydrolase [Chloroflexia bacterium]|nr:Rid family hydrolase [Chloroflexia bacterium]